MSTTVIQARDLFPLGVLERELEGFRPPTAPFDPQGAWKNSYRILTLAAIPKVLHSFQVGTLTIERTPAPAGGARLAIHSERVHLPFTKMDQPFAKVAPEEYRQVITAEFECAGNELASPRSWRLNVEVLSPAGRPIKELGLEMSGAVREGAVEIITGSRLHHASAEGPATHAWALFDAVQRQPRAAGQAPLSFTLWDHLGQLKPGHTLAYRASSEVELGAQGAGQNATRLHAWHELGEGVVPTVYFTDEQGRLLFVMAGIEGYVLDPGASS
jgi:hypothetical protein